MNKTGSFNVVYFKIAKSASLGDKSETIVGRFETRVVAKSAISALAQVNSRPSLDGLFNRAIKAERL